VKPNAKAGPAAALCSFGLHTALPQGQQLPVRDLPAVATALPSS
jgi:hypothetical protein